jgi:hypothetical protein
MARIGGGRAVVLRLRSDRLASRRLALTRVMRCVRCGLGLLVLAFVMWAATGVAYACDPVTGQGCDMTPSSSQPPASQPATSAPPASRPPASSTQPPGESFIPPGSTRTTPTSPPGEAFIPPGAATGSTPASQPLVNLAAQPPGADSTPVAVTPTAADTSKSSGGSDRPWWRALGGGAALCGAGAAAGAMTSDTKKVIGTIGFAAVGVIGVLTGGLAGLAVFGVGVIGEVAIWGFGALDDKKPVSATDAPAPVKEYKPAVAAEHYKNLEDAEIPTQPKSAAGDPNTIEDTPR